jgi:fibronectin type 3 domain-containing protein
MQIQISGDNANVDSVYPNNNYKTYDKDAARMSNLKTALQATFAASQDPIIVPEPDYNGAYGKTFAAVVSRIQNTSLTFTPNSVGATPITIGMKPKAIQELFELQYGRMNATMGVEIPNTTGVNQTTIPLGYVDPSTENIDDSMTATAPTLTDGTQIWKVTHNGVDTHAIHFHLFNVQIINRVGWDGQVRLPEANEIGWKDTVRMNPLEDAIVALRPIAAKSPFGTYQSVRPLDVTAPLGSRMNFWPQDPLGNPVQTVNKLYNFGDEYVWHCHLLGHEENDMMRPIVFNTSRIAPPVPTSVAAANLLSGAVKLDWIDATLPTPGYGVTGNSWGNPTGEIGYIILRQDNGTGNFIEIGRASANATTFTDSTVASGSYSYKVVAFNGASASADSNISLSASDPVAITVAGTVVAPSAPTNLAASFLAPPLGVNLTWTAATGHVDSYTVTRNDNKTWTNIGTTSFTDSSVAANTSYSYTVTAVNTAGNATSDSLAVLTLPDAPTGLGATTSPTDVTLNWTAPAGTISGYTIERSTDKVSFQTIATTLTATPSYIDNNVLSNASYFYRVKANNTTGESAATPWLFVTVKANLPDAPTGLTPILAPAAPTQVNLTWAAGSAIPVTSYLIERSPDGTTGSWTQVGSADTTSFIDTGVTANTSYYYHIIATNSAYSPSYGPASISADLQVVTLPNAATALIGTLNRTGGADLSWVAPIGGATSYTVQRNDGVSGWADVMSVTAIAPATIPDTTYSDASVVANTTYSYRILANNSTPAAGLASNEVTVVVPPALPNVATSLTATATATGVNLSWTAPTSVVSSYRIERRNSVSAVNVQAGLWGAVGTSNTPAFTDNTTASNISYDYQVIAINAAGDAPASAFASALTLPDAVTGLSFEANTTGVALKWTAVAGNGTVTYTVERQDGATWKLVGSTQGTTATDTDTLAGNTSYTYRVTASNATGNGPSLTITALTVPDAPTNLNGALNTSGAILTWTAPSGAISSYTIERSADNGGTWDILSDTLTGTSYTDSTNGTASNTTYSYRVSAKNSSGLGAASATFNLLSLPGVATNLTAKQVGAVINLAWTAPAGKIIGYLVQRSTDDGATWTVVNGALTPAPAFTDTPVAGNTNYSYSVTAYNATGAGQASSVAKVLTIPAAPTVSAAVQFGPQVALTLTSTGNEPSPGYTIQRRTSAIPATGGRRAVPAGAWATITPSTPYIDTTVVANTSYDYQATATNTSGTGPNSTPTTIAVPALPTAPTNLAARAPAGINVVLTWRNSTTNQTNVIIERTAAGGTLLFTEIGRVAGTVTTFTDTPPTPLSSYVYRVRAITIAGSSPVSNQVTFIAPFPAPSGLAAPAASITTNSITLNWTSNTPNATGFVVERSPNGNTWTTVGTVAQTTATTYSFTNTGLTTRTTYRYRVRAFFNPLGGTTYVAGTSLVSANTATLQVRTP